MYLQKLWYIVYTKPGLEKKVAGLLARKDYEHFFAVHKVEKRQARKRVIAEEPLIESYLFIRAAREEHETIKAIEGIVNFIYWLSEPAVVNNDEIDTLKLFLHNYSNIKKEKLAMDAREHHKHADSNLLTHHAERHDPHRVYLPSIGYAFTAGKQIQHVEKIPEYRIRNRYVKFLRIHKSV